MKLSVIVPVFNEKNTIAHLLAKVRAARLPAGMEKEIVVIDDGTTEILNNYLHDASVRIIQRPKNEGKTAAVRDGLASATGDILLIQDADLEYDPACYPDLVAPILSGSAKVVYGSRFKGEIKNMTFINRCANRISTWTFNRLFGAEISDLNTCYKVFHRDILKDTVIISRNFIFDAELAVKTVVLGYKIHEVPIVYTARPKSGGKKITWGKALELYWWMIRFWLKNLNNRKRIS